MRTSLLAATLLLGACAGGPAESPSLVDERDAVSPDVVGRLPVPFTDAQLADVLRHSPLPPPPPDPTNAVADDPDAAHLGQFLFYDERLSGRSRLSCASCHDPAQGFSDGRSLSEGVEVLTRHSPTLWNVAYQRWFFWDGRRDTLWSQALVPIEHPKEMAANRVEVVRRVFQDVELSRAYERIFGALPDMDDPRFPPYGRPIPDDEDHPHRPREPERHGHEDHPYQAAWTAMAPADRDAVDRAFSNLGKAIAAYERRLVSRHSPFDMFVQGLRTGDAEKLAALDASAQRGLALFVGEGRCNLCHSGPEFSDREFHNVLVPPLDATLPEDAGRHGGLFEVRNHGFAATGPYGDAPQSEQARKIDYLVDRAGVSDHHTWGQFKTPGLRNVALSPPYMHQGQLPDLATVLDHYSSFDPSPPLRGHVEAFLQPLDLTAEQRGDLEAFLRSLTDADIDPRLLRAPASPLRPPMEGTP